MMKSFERVCLYFNIKLMKKLLPTVIKSTAAAPKNSLLTDFLKVQKREQSTLITEEVSTKEDKKGENKRAMKAASKKEPKVLYELPKSYNHTHEHGNGSFKNGKVNIWMWNINGINAVLKKGNMQHFIDSANPDIICFNETKIDKDKIE